MIACFLLDLTKPHSSRTRVRAGIDSGLGSIASKAGDIEINATQATNIDESVISNVVFDGSFGNGGNINITTGSLSLTNGAVLNASTSGQGDAGGINILARDTVSFDGVNSNGFSTQVFSNVEETGVGNAGNINITTGSLSVTNGAVLIARTYGQGDAGNVTIHATDTVSFNGAGPTGSYASTVFTRVESGAVGNGGDINITTGSLFLTNGGALNSSTYGQGNAGNVTINALNTVSMSGTTSSDEFLRSGIFSSVVPGAMGSGGNITITTGSLSVTNNARMAADTQGQGDAGNITIQARNNVSFDGGNVFSTVANGAVGNGGNIEIASRSLTVTNGSKLLTLTRGQGDAGNIIVNATDSVTISGSNPNFDSRLAPFDRIILDRASSDSGLFANTVDSASEGGDIRITTGQLIVRDSGQIGVTSTGLGGAGNIKVQAGSIELDNQASLSAETTGGQGNINLRSPTAERSPSRDILLLRRGSSITTNAIGNSTGGNITIDTSNLVAVPKENSDISANAENSFGGQVIINASGIFGTQFRLEPTPLSDITASSARGSEFNGVVQLNTPDVNPSQGLTTLPTNIIDTSQLIANSCIARSKRPEGKFIITGNGGLPVMPDDPSIAPYQTYQIPTVTSASISTPQENTATDNKHELLTPMPLIEAQGWIYGANGEVILTASAPTVAPGGSWSQLPTCSGS
ncbi:S-layer family protein [Nostoc sp. FACHB-133]|uniref:beta strand repeat-containing protein n=1 Tax=Nostoc sp. FACHB-133 TaxID=2692835 RepID=UPI001683940D|nr:S-layer family protein [Nostoc sp. FACHB-133]MBD2527919.1 S-layer family protein [Nostoc sp. FACHB-133]